MRMHLIEGGACGEDRTRVGPARPPPTGTVGHEDCAHGHGRGKGPVKVVVRVAGSAIGRLLQKGDVAALARR